MERDEFSKSTIEMLAKRVAYRCSNPNCRKVTIGANTDSSKVTLIGEAAHITAASPGGPRYNEELTKDERKSIDNGIWLCARCATLIDRDTKLYPEQLLREWKRSAEAETMMMLPQGLISEEHIVPATEIGDKPIVTMLIGNGFDESMDMRTSYEEFFDWYCNQPANTLDSTMRRNYERYVKELIYSNVRWNTWSDFERDLITFAANTQFDIDRNNFKALYYNILSKIAEYILLNQERVLRRLQDENPSFISGFKKGLLNWKNELDDEERMMVSEDEQTTNYKYQFINFNFSEVFDTILSKAFNTPDLVHVHGCINDTRNIIIGVDDVSLISTCFKEEELYYLIKNKLNNAEGIEKSWIRKVECYLWNSQVICIYGMSIGKTDSMWWKKIVQWLLRGCGHHLIIFWHNRNELDLLDMRTLKTRVINRLLCFSDLTDTEKYLLLKRIHVVINPREFLQVRMEDGVF